MRRSGAVACGLVLALAGGSCASPRDDVSSGSGPSVQESSTTADETSTTRAEEVPAAPAAPSTSPMLAINGPVTVPDGEPGELRVVLVGPADDGSGSLPVVVRNRTDETVYNVEASGTARSADGSLVGSGSSQGFAPTAVAPGEWAFGYVYFSTLPGGDATFDVTATGSTDAGILSSVDVKPVETSVMDSEFGGKTVIGIVSNDTSKEVGGPVSVMLACFDEPGTAIIGAHIGYTDADAVAPQGTASFSVDLFDDPCPVFAVGASGYDF